MRVLLDECMPESFRKHIVGHDVRTVRYMGWKGRKNGLLIASMLQEGFELLITTDRNLPHQQNLRAAGISVIVLAGPTTEFVELLKLVPMVLAAMRNIQPGEFIEVSP